MQNPKNSPPIQVLQNWAYSRGFQMPQQATVIVPNGPYNFSVLYSAVIMPNVGNGYMISIPIMPNCWNKRLLKDLRKSLKFVKGVCGFSAPSNTVTICLRKVNVKNFTQHIDAVILALTDVLTNHQVPQNYCCYYCGQPNCDSGIFRGFSMYPTHSACVHNHIQAEVTKIQENETNGNYVLATIGAVIGGIIGAIPSAIAYFLFGYIIAFLNALIPLAASKGYRICKGKENKYMLLLLSILSILAPISFVVIELYIYATLINLASGIDAFPNLSQMLSVLRDPEFAPTMVWNFLLSLVFSLLGLLTAWSSIRKTNAKKLQELTGGGSEDMAITRVPTAVCAPPTSYLPAVVSPAVGIMPPQVQPSYPLPATPEQTDLQPSPTSDASQEAAKALGLDKRVE